MQQLPLRGTGAQGPTTGTPVNVAMDVQAMADGASAEASSATAAISTQMKRFRRRDIEELYAGRSDFPVVVHQACNIIGSIASPLGRTRPIALACR